jgi:hypothetical protein
LGKKRGKSDRAAMHLTHQSQEVVGEKHLGDD